MSLHLWLRRLHAVCTRTRPAVPSPHRSQSRRLRTLPQLELLEGRLLPANAVQLNVASLFNADVIVKNGPNGLIPATSPVDQNLPGGDWSFMTQSAATVVNPANPHGMPDNALFPADSFHPDVQLTYNTLDQSNNVRRQEQDLTNFSFNVPAVAYTQLHLFATAGTGSSSFEVQLNYADGSASTSPVFTVPDWFTQISESSSGYYLINGLDRVSPDGSTLDTSHLNSFSIFGFEVDPDPTKVLQSVTVEPQSVSGTFDFFGATALTNATYLGSSGASITPTEGQAFTGTVASFTAANANAPANDFTASITWGDGATTTGTVSGTGGNFVVTGSHTYAQEGSDPLAVTITEGTGGARVTTTSTATVSDAPLAVTGHNFRATTDVPTGRVVVATFTDPGGAEPKKDYSAVINWGDGSPTSVGKIKANKDGTFSVAGHHDYTKQGQYSVQVTINHEQAPPASVTDTVTVADSVPVAVVALAHGRTSRNVQLTVGYADEALKDHSLQIDWGDGTQQTFDLRTHRDGLAFVTHDFSSQVNQSKIVVTIVDNDGTASAPIVLTTHFNKGYNDLLTGTSWGWQSYASLASELEVLLYEHPH